MPDLYLCGAGNSEGVRLALRVNERERRWGRILLLDDDPGKRGRRLLGVEVLGPLAMLADLPREGAEVVNLVARTTPGRMAVRRRLESFGARFAPLVSPDVDLLGVELDPDVVVYRHATLGPETRLGSGTVVFMGAVVGHESRLGPGCIVAANAVINARVRLGEGVYLGAGAAILPEVTVGAWTTIGAGSMVAYDVPAGMTVLGVPGKSLPLHGPAARPPAAQPRPAREEGFSPEPALVGDRSRRDRPAP